MLFVLIPSLLAVSGLVVAGRAVYRKIPQDRTGWDADVAKHDFGPTFYEKALAAAAVKTREAALSVSTKLVYKLKITSLKSDNFLSKILQRIKYHKENTQTRETVLSQEQEVVMVKKASSDLAAGSSEEIKISFETSPVVGVDDNSEVLEKPKSVSPFLAKEQQFISQLAYNPKDVSVYKKLGWLYLENSMPIQARQAFKMAVKLGSKDKLVVTKLLEMGGVLHKEGTGDYNSSQAIEKAGEKAIVSRVVEATHVSPKKHRTQKVKRLKITKV